MKIAIVSGDDFLHDDPRQLCTALAARGHEAIACVRERRSKRKTTDGYRTVPIPVGPGAPAPAPQVLPYVGEWVTALERVWASEEPDVVHAYGWLGGLAAQLAARRRRTPSVQTFMGVAATSRPQGADGAGQGAERRRIEQLLARSATWVTGECSADVDALARMRRSRTGVSTLTSGVDVERFSPVGPAAARTDLHRVLCLVSNPLSRGGADIAIRALPKVPGAELIIAETGQPDRGHDEARDELRRLAAEIGVADRVRFAGGVADAELPMLMRSADVVACTPRQPPRATTVLQAMASGVVVVTLPVGVLADAVIDNVTGVLLPTASPGALGSALRSLLTQRFQCESMGAAGRSRALSRFSWDRIAQDALNIYRQLEAQRAAPPELQATVTR